MRRNPSSRPTSSRERRWRHGPRSLASGNIFPVEWPPQLPSRSCSMSLVLALILSAGVAAQADQDPLAALVEVLKISDDDSFRLHILKGIRDGLKGRTTVAMAKGWPDVSTKLAKSPNGEVRSLAQMISITFGDPTALTSLRGLLAGGKAGANERED